MGALLIASFLCAAGMSQRSPELPTAVWAARLSWRADIKDSKAVVTDKLCAIPARVFEV